jgi:hypothetical protein
VRLEFVIPSAVRLTKIKKADLSEPTEPKVDYQQLPAEPELSRTEPK